MIIAITATRKEKKQTNKNKKIKSERGKKKAQKTFPYTHTPKTSQGFINFNICFLDIICAFSALVVSKSCLDFTDLCMSSQALACCTGHSLHLCYHLWKSGKRGLAWAMKSSP